MRQSSDGFMIPCANCRRVFDSIGSRYCSSDCERRYCERQRNLDTMVEVGIEPATKRVCANPDCSVVIPKWRDGRRVSSKTRFCSLKRKVKANRAAA